MFIRVIVVFMEPILTRMKKKETTKLEAKDINTSAIINKSKCFRDVSLNLSNFH